MLYHQTLKTVYKKFCTDRRQCSEPNVNRSIQNCICNRITKALLFSLFICVCVYDIVTYSRIHVYIWKATVLQVGDGIISCIYLLLHISNVSPSFYNEHNYFHYKIVKIFHGNSLFIIRFSCRSLNTYYSSARILSVKEFKWPYLSNKDKLQTTGKHLKYIHNCCAAVSLRKYFTCSHNKQGVWPQHQQIYSQCISSLKIVWPANILYWCWEYFGLS